jgi:hypothetical protein
MLGITLKIDERSIDKAQKRLNKSNSSDAITTGASAGAGAIVGEEIMDGMEEEKTKKKPSKTEGSMLGKLGVMAGGIMALVTFVKPIKQLLEVIGAIISIGLKPLLPLLRIFLLAGVWIFKKLNDFFKKIFSPGRKEKVEGMIPEATGEGFLSELYNNLIRPLLLFGGMIGDWLYEAIILPLFKFGMAIGDWLYEAIILPVSDGITSVIFFVSDILKKGFSYLVEGLNWIWNTLLKPVFISLWNGIKWVWSNLLNPIWSWLSEKFKSIWNNIIKPVWEFIKEKFNSIKNFLGKIVDAIKSVYNTIKDAISKIPFVGDGDDSETIVTDALITSKGDIVKFHPKDNIMAFQKTPPISGGTTINIKVDGFVGDEDLLAEKIEKAISSRNRGGLSQF